ncbi:Uu.00g106820.m01.CDS01 [Anthostomella pinea]|uniref:Uu.00g106820.m01.CDS01 n=1 Tax=Anthostomella pinea TaxID=933095 RepID=A0AAI8VE95_9PEZI|nr:Uu.00g106820.m01.CDS01 [Anthostomella pinea]
MAYNSYHPNTQPDRRSSHGLNHKISGLSDADSSSGLRGRESLVSLQSYHESPPLGNVSEENDYSRASWSVPLPSLGGAGGRFQPVSPSTSASGLGGRFKSFRARVAQPETTIHEDESIDMSLLRSAAPPGQSPSSYAPVSATEPAFDLTSFAGPMGTHDDEFLKTLQVQEASGQLTGGLGQGEQSPNTVIKGDQLLSPMPSLRRTLTQSLSMRRTRTPSAGSRSGGWEDLGQEEANKRGEVIEVIIEEESADVDLSSMVGPSPMGMDPDRARHSITLPAQTSQKRVFYPQPNWKPFWLRWPYLLFMIVLSIALAICQEVLYQQATRKPLISFTKAEDIDPGFYFVFKYVPTIITVTYGVLWQCTDFEVSRLEAYYQMSKEGGALAAESINVDYITMFNFARPLFALQRKHYAVAVSSVATLLAVSLVPTLGSAALVLNPSRAMRLSDPSLEKTITVSSTLSRLLTITFFVIAMLGCVLYYQLNTRRSGLLSDVKGIAGLASMAVVSHIMMDFKDMDTVKPKDIHRRLKNHRYVLRNSSLAPEDDSKTPVSRREIDSYNETHLSENPHPLMLRARGCIPFIAGILLFLGFIPVFLFTPASALTEHAPWVVTALAVCIKLGWGSLETAIRMMEPYYILSKRHAPAKTLTLDYTAMPFAAVALRALYNRHWVVVLVGWGTVMVEGLTIFATSLAAIEGRDFLSRVSEGEHSLDKGLGSGSETVRSFVVTLALTVFILIYLAVVAGVVFVRRRHPFLPRQPNTIASVLAFMHQSKMLYDFVGTAKFTNAQMMRRLDDIGKTYGLGWFDGRDGQTHCGVDEEELSGNYKHGIDAAQGNKPWLTEWQLF